MMKSGQYQALLPDERVLAAEVLYGRGPFFRMKGLLCRKELASDEGILLRPCNAIHMFFMKFAIDAIFLDREGKILCIYESIQPWRMTPVVRGSRAVLEIQAGRCRECGVQEGMELRFIPSESRL